jgi:hypothetical protein
MDVVCTYAAPSLLTEAFFSPGPCKVKANSSRTIPANEKKANFCMILFLNYSPDTRVLHISQCTIFSGNFIFPGYPGNSPIKTGIHNHLQFRPNRPGYQGYPENQIVLMVP